MEREESPVEEMNLVQILQPLVRYDSNSVVESDIGNDTVSGYAYFNKI